MDWSEMDVEISYSSNEHHWQWLFIAFQIAILWGRCAAQNDACKLLVAPVKDCADNFISALSSNTILIE